MREAAYVEGAEEAGQFLWGFGCFIGKSYFEAATIDFSVTARRVASFDVDSDSDDPDPGPRVNAFISRTTPWRSRRV